MDATETDRCDPFGSSGFSDSFILSILFILSKKSGLDLIVRIVANTLD